MTDQSGAGSAGGGRLGLDTDTVELAVKTLASRLVTVERIQVSRHFFTDGAYSLSSSAIGACYGYILSPLLRLVPAT
eukprot:1179468-Pyramimonas_sp.AAC.1